jgi:hypothetical protein
MDRMHRHAHLLPIALSALGFYLLSGVNDLLFEWTDYDHGVNWVFLPSGLRLALVLLLGGPGAIGVMLGSFFSGLHEPTPLAVHTAASVISGGAPWLAYWICKRSLQIQSNLGNLTPGHLLKMAMVFSLTSAVLHQALYVPTGLSESFIKSGLVMTVGDLLGCLAVLYGLKVVIGLKVRGA